MRGRPKPKGLRGEAGAYSGVPKDTVILKKGVFKRGEENLGVETGG